MFEFIVADLSQIELVKPFWEKLITHLSEKSVHFPQTYLSFLEGRVEKFKEKQGRIRVELIKEAEIIGCAVCSINENNDGHIDMLYVEPEYRGKGLGDRLVQNMLAWFNENSIKHINLYVTYGNEAVLPFYAKYGLLPIRYELNLKEKE